MPYLYSDEQNQIREEVRRTLVGTVDTATMRRLLETKAGIDEALWQTARDMGWTAMGIAEDDGGLGLSLIETLIVAEEMGRVVPGLPFLATSFAASYALKQGRRADLLPAVAAGERIATLAFAEGSEPLPAEIGVVLSPDLRLTGEKTAVLAGARADIALVLCKDVAGRPQIVVVDLASPQVEREVFECIDNSRCLANLRFDAVPVEVLELDDPHRTAQASIGFLALHLAAEGLGGTDTCIRLACEYANQRQAFGQAIGKFQAVKHAVAEMYVAGELARASILDATVRVQDGDSDALAYVAAARLNAVHAYEGASAAATQIHGGTGVTWEADLHLHYRRSRSLAAEAGPLWFWEDRIVSQLEAA